MFGRNTVNIFISWPETGTNNAVGVEQCSIEEDCVADCIRGKDTEALLAAVSSGAVDVNFTDDVGQTLLNWAAAFGTKEMVEFLCEKG